MRFGFGSSSLSGACDGRGDASGCPTFAAMQNLPLPIVALGGLLLGLCSCGPDPSAASAGFTEPDELGPNASIIRNPVAGGGPVDTVNVARLRFDAETFEFGTAPRGEVIEHDYRFVNDGGVPLLITDARSTCGCTVADYPKQPVPPGGQGTISVRFDTKNKSGRQRKPITLTANTYPATTTLYVAGTVTTDE